MLIRVYSIEYGKYLWKQVRLCKKLQVIVFWQKVFLPIWMCTFKMWPLEAAILQGKVRLSHKKL